MNADWLLGALIGLAAAAGAVLAVRAAPPMLSVRLVDRIAATASSRRDAFARRPDGLSSSASARPT